MTGGRQGAGPLPKVILITGFLGSGKTSFVLRVSEQLSREGSRIAIVENEVGEVGVDGQFLKSRGLALKEIYAGCVCCQVSGDLVPVLQALRDEYSPDVVLIEASGVAEPQPILETLSKYCPGLDLLSVTIVDGERVRLYTKILSHLIKTQIDGAEVVVLNKSDLLDAHEIRDLVRVLHEANPRSLILVISATGKLEPWIGNLLRGASLAVTPYTFNIEIESEGNRDPADLLRDFMVEAALECVASGIPIIGHMKVYLEDDERRFLHGSLTSPSACNVEAREGIPSSAVLSGVGNLIAYGADGERLHQCTVRAASGFPGVRVKRFETGDCHSRRLPNHV